MLTRWIQHKLNHCFGQKVHTVYSCSKLSVCRNWVTFHEPGCVQNVTLGEWYTFHGVYSNLYCAFASSQGKQFKISLLSGLCPHFKESACEMQLFETWRMMYINMSWECYVEILPQKRARRNFVTNQTNDKGTNTCDKNIWKSTHHSLQLWAGICTDCGDFYLHSGFSYDKSKLIVQQKSHQLSKRRSILLKCAVQNGHYFVEYKPYLWLDMLHRNWTGIRTSHLELCQPRRLELKFNICKKNLLCVGKKHKVKQSEQIFGASRKKDNKWIFLNINWTERTRMPTCVNITTKKELSIVNKWIILNCTKCGKSLKMNIDEEKIFISQVLGDKVSLTKVVEQQWSMTWIRV